MELQEEEKKSSLLSKIQWIFFVVLIPMLFALAVALVVLTFAGVDVAGAAKEYGAHIPGVSKLVADKDTIDVEDKLRKDIKDLEASNKEQVETISDLEKEIKERDTELEKLKDDIAELTEQLNNEEQETGSTDQSSNKISKAFESMSAKNAAAIVTELQDEEALAILQTLSTDTLSSVLEKMAPVDAAKYTKMLADAS